MSVQAMAWAMDQTVVSDASARHVLLILANYADQEGRGAHPAVATIVRQTGLSERTVQTKIEHLLATTAITPGNPALVAANIIRSDRRPNVYDLNMYENRGAIVAPRPTKRTQRDAVFAPRDSKRGANYDTTRGNLQQSGVQPETERGAAAAPEPPLTTPEPPKNHPSAPAVPAVTVTPEDFAFDWQEPVEPTLPAPVAEVPTVRQRQPGVKSQQVREPLFVPPEWVPAEAWAGWVDMRKRLRVPNTERALRGAVRVLDGLVQAGWDAEQVIDLATTSGWKSFYEPRDKSMRSAPAAPERLNQTRRGVDALRAAMDQQTRSTISVAGAAVSGPAHLLARIANGATK